MRVDIAWPDLIDLTYEAAFVPELWPSILDQLGEITRSPAAGIILYEDTRPARFTANAMKIDSLGEFVSSDDLWTRNQRIQYFHKHPFTGFVAAKDYYSKDFLEEDAIYLLDQRTGLDHQIGTMVPMPSGELVVYAFHRRKGDDPYGPDDIARMNDLHPHLARSGLMAARLSLEPARATASALQAMGLAAAVMSSTGRVQATNALFDAMPWLFLTVAFGGIAIADMAANSLFQEAVRAVGHRGEAVVRSIPVKARDDRQPLVIHVLPLRRNAHDIFSGADVLIAATGLNPSNLVPSPSILTGLFDLAPSEARLAVALTEGRALKDFAAEAGITFGTARKYLDRIYLKTGTHRQNELVSLLKGAQPLGASMQGAGHCPTT